MFALSSIVFDGLRLQAHTEDSGFENAMMRQFSWNNLGVTIQLFKASKPISKFWKTSPTNVPYGDLHTRKKKVWFDKRVSMFLPAQCKANVVMRRNLAWGMKGLYWCFGPCGGTAFRLGFVAKQWTQGVNMGSRAFHFANARCIGELLVRHPKMLLHKPALAVVQSFRSNSWIRSYTPAACFRGHVGSQSLYIKQNWCSPSKLLLTGTLNASFALYNFERYRRAFRGQGWSCHFHNGVIAW